ncbi:MAG: ribosome recycling factor [Patescibacteria group bacterium]
MNIDQAINTAVAEFDKNVQHLQVEFSRLQVGRASSILVEDIPVEVYGATQTVKSIASISIPEARSLVIQPWDRNLLGAIEKAIVGTGTGLNPVNDGILIRINIPALTEERRLDLNKKVKKIAEEARITLRNIRQDAHNSLKQLKADSEITEDEWKGADKKLQVKVDEFNSKIEELSKAKEVEVMTV